MDVELHVEGMVCEACVQSVERALARLGDGVLSADVRLGSASVRYEPTLLSEAQVLEGNSLLRWS